MIYRRIIVTGLYRSGTTLLYNAVRLLAVRAVGKHAVYGCYAGDYDISNRAIIHVVKTAEYLPHLALGSEIVYIYRPIEEVRASMLRFAAFHPEPRRDTDVARLDEYYRWLLAWTSHGAKAVMYGELDLGALAAALSFSLDAAEIRSTAEELATLVPPETGTDPVTLLHAHHRTLDHAQKQHADSEG